MAPRTPATWLTHWLEVVHEDDGINASTRVAHESICRAWITPRVGDVTLDRVTIQHGAKLQAVTRAGQRPASRRRVVLPSALDAALREKLKAIADRGGEGREAPWL